MPHIKHALKAVVVVLAMMGVWLFHHEGRTVLAVFLAACIGYGVGWYECRQHIMEE